MILDLKVSKNWQYWIETSENYHQNGATPKVHHSRWIFKFKIQRTQLIQGLLVPTRLFNSQNLFHLHGYYDLHVYYFWGKVPTYTFNWGPRLLGSWEYAHPNVKNLIPAMRNNCPNGLIDAAILQIVPYESSVFCGCIVIL